MDNTKDCTKLTRHDFPSNFIFGAAASAYQIEGAYEQGRKGLNNWDVFTLQRPGKIVDGSNGCLAIDHYNLFKEDVKLMKKLGLDTYRFSISWARILPGGRLSAGINKEGVQFYNDLIDLLISEGITPFVTIFHLEVPQILQDECTGFLGHGIVEAYAEFAEVCFFEFGDRVKFWVTINEPLGYTSNSFIYGNFPPCHHSTSKSPSEYHGAIYRGPQVVDKTFTRGNPGKDPYTVGHNLLLAHAKAVDIYRRKYQAVQGGKIGLVNQTFWYEPYSSSQEDVDARARALDFSWGWFIEPIVYGNYPLVMQERVGNRLPTITAKEKELLKGSFDFIGVNYYTANYAKNDIAPASEGPTYTSDMGVSFSAYNSEGHQIGKQAGSEWLYIVPYGIYNIVKYNMEKYNNPLVYITENGVDEKNDLKEPVGRAIKDDYRIQFYQEHLAYVMQAIEEGANVKGFIMWALFDNFEWAEGHTVRFGLYFVDFYNRLIRYPKHSAIWYMNFLNKNPPLPSTKRLVAEEVVETDINSAKRKRNR